MNDPARNPYTAGTGLATGAAGGVARFRQPVLTGKLITVALAMGLVTTTGIVSFLGLQSLPEGEPLFRFGGDATLFIVIGFGKLVICAIGWVVMRTIFNRRIAEILNASETPFPVPIQADSELPPQTDAAIQAVMTSTIVGQALMEGPAMTCAVLLFIERNGVFLIPIVIGLVGVLMQLPTESKYKARLENAAL